MNFLTDNKRLLISADKYCTHHILYGTTCLKCEREKQSAIEHEDSSLNRLLKSKPFPVVDILTWTDKEKDQAVIAYLQDMGERGFAATYKMSGTSDKNRHYQSFEGAIRDLIDRFNEVNL